MARMADSPQNICKAEKKCLYVMHRNNSAIQKWEIEIERVTKNCCTPSFEYFMDQKEEVNYGKIVFCTESHARHAMKELSRCKFYARFWQTSDEIHNGVVKLSSNQKPGIVQDFKEASSGSVMPIKKARSYTSTFSQPKEAATKNAFWTSSTYNSTTSKSQEMVQVIVMEFPCPRRIMAYLVDNFHETEFISLWKSIVPVQVHCKGQKLYVKGTAHEIQIAKSKVLNHRLTRAVTHENSGCQKHSFHFKKNKMSVMTTTNNSLRNSFHWNLCEHKKSSNKYPSNCESVEVTVGEFPCSKQIMAYLLYRFYETDFINLWKSIKPVQVYCKGQKLYVKGTAHDIQEAKSKVLEHSLTRGLLFKSIPDLRNGIPQRICKQFSVKFPMTILLDEVDSSCDPLLCGRNLSELQEAKIFLMKVISQCEMIHAQAGTQLDLYEEEFEYGWHQIQTCYRRITETVFITNSQLSQLLKTFTDKANHLSCKIDVAKMPQNSNDCVPLTIKGYTKKNVSETAEFISSKCIVKENMMFKDISAADVLTSQYSKWSKHAQRKKIHLSKLKDGCGFLVEGNPKPVKEMIKSLLQSYHSTLENAAKIRFGQVVLRSFYRPVCTTEIVSEWKESVKREFKSDMTLSLLPTNHPNDGFVVYFQVSQDRVVIIKIVIGRLSMEETDAIVVPTDSVKNDRHYPIKLTCLKEESFQDGYKSCLHSFQVLKKVGSTEILDAGKLPCLRILHIVYPASLLSTELSESDFVSKTLCFASEKQVGSISFPDIDPQVMASVIKSLTSLNSPTIHTVRIVVGNKDRVKLYAAAILKQVVSVSPRLSSTHQTSLASFKKYQWSWKDDNGVIVSYDPVATKLLNEAYDKNPAGTCTLQIFHQHYTVDFQTMKQCNVSSLHKREVFKSSPKVQISQESVMWKYLDDSGRFSAYLPRDATQIEAMYQKKVDSEYMMIHSRMYSFDFDNMLQVNAETGYSRKLKREKAAFQNKPSFQSGFLHEDEVLINFKCPTQHYQNVKKYIHDRIEQQLSCEDINLPVSCLLDYLKPIIKKHSMMVSFELITDGPIQEKRTVLRVKGSAVCVQKAQAEIQKVIIYNVSSIVQPPLNNMKCPHTWEPMTEKEQCKIVQLDHRSDEYGDVLTSFMDTMPDYEVVDIQRVQNKWIWERYAMTKRRMREKNNGRVNELELFHGSRKSPAESICKSEEGFDMRFSREGLWGRANYFAKNASYSDTYAYSEDPKGKTKEMMLAQVLTGDSYECKQDRALIMPPEKSGPGSDTKSELIQRYDSVCGITNNCKVYMTYCNENAYPAYIIKYAARGSCTTIRKPSSKVTTAQLPSNSKTTQRATTTKPSHSSQVPAQQPPSFQVAQQQQPASSHVVPVQKTPVNNSDQTKYSCIIS